MLHDNNKGTEEHAHPRRLISAFVFSLLAKLQYSSVVFVVQRAKFSSDQFHIIYMNKESGFLAHARIQRRGQGVRNSLLKNHKNIGFLSNTGSDPLKKHKATKPVFHDRPSSIRQFRLRADDGPFIVVISGSSFRPSSAKKTLWIRACCYGG